VLALHDVALAAQGWQGDALKHLLLKQPAQHRQRQGQRI
jgi:hypothetical protein